MALLYSIKITMHDSKHTNNTLDMSQNQYFQHPEYLTPGKHVYNSNKQKTKSYWYLFFVVDFGKTHIHDVHNPDILYLIEVK